jgi:hypothetical protein
MVSRKLLHWLALVCRFRIMESRELSRGRSARKTPLRMQIDAHHLRDYLTSLHKSQAAFIFCCPFFSFCIGLPFERDVRNAKTLSRRCTICLTLGCNARRKIMCYHTSLPTSREGVDLDIGLFDISPGFVCVTGRTHQVAIVS